MSARGRPLQHEKPHCAIARFEGSGRALNRTPARDRPFQVYSVAGLMPFLRQSSAVFTPASASLRIARIFSSLNRDFFIRVLRGGKLYSGLVRIVRGLQCVCKSSSSSKAELGSKFEPSR